MSAEAIVAAAPEQIQPEVHFAPPKQDAVPHDSPKPIGLNSPPDSNSAIKTDASDSELSDLEDSVGEAVPPLASTPAEAEAAAPVADDEDEDIGEVLPDHYSGTVPVFKPDMHQFKDFKKFMEKVDCYGMKSGIIKIIPPQEWKDQQPPLDELVKRVRVREPIKQDIMGSNGTYRQVNILHQRSYNIPQWRQLCDQSEHQPPARRGERRAQPEKPKATGRTRAAASSSNNNSASSTPAKRRGPGRPSKGRGKKQATKDDDEDPERPMTPVSPKPEEEVAQSVEQDPDAEIDDDDSPKASRMGRMGGVKPSKDKTQSVSARRKNAKREGSVLIDEAAFKDWDYRMDISDYTPERCEDLERIYWKTLTYAPPLYGADLAGTLFDDRTENWNLSKLPSLLDVLGTKIPGVNTAYLYLGMWKATFAWHLEDVDLYSINYLHFGAPKQWYSISQADARRFEAAMKNIWPTEAKACSQFLRHKGFLISPNHLLQQYNIRVNKVVSYPGEFVVTYPYGYHSGYNLGYNCAEAVNFALDTWLPMGKIAKRCECAQAQDSVWIDAWQIERRLRGEETEYEETEDEEEEEDEDEEDNGILTPRSSHTVKLKIPGRKRKRAANEKDGRKVKKIRVRVKAHAEPPCCLCPHNISGAEVLPTDDGRKAHRLCALYLPETYIETVDEKEIISNIANIDKARLELKCLYCRSKKGACFQCSQKKCARSYHATCAAAAGVFVEEGDVPVFGEDGTEYKEQAFEFSCRFHRTKRDKKYDGEALEQNEKIREAAAALKEGDTCQMQYYRGDIFAGVVVENRTDEETLLLDIIPSGDRVEVQWKWLLLPDPSDFHLPKASANALPMPTNRKAKAEINATKRPTEDLPRSDAPFVDGYTWAEFHTAAPANSVRAKVDLAKHEQIWFYLGKTSTEARAQYTENPKKQQHNSKSNFLESVRPPPAPRPPQTGYFGGVYSNTHRPQPLANGAAKQEKPYQYKPRHSISTTFVPPPRPQYSSQQYMPKSTSATNTSSNRGHHSHSLSFGSDPRFKSFPKTPSSSYQAKERSMPSVNHSPFSLGFSQPPGLGFSPPTNIGRSPHTSSRSRSNSVRSLKSLSAQSNTNILPPISTEALVSAYSKRPEPVAKPNKPTVIQKYAFFQLHRNRDSTKYRTPYGPYGGFTNGYEGNLREYLIKTPGALFEAGSRRMSSGFAGSSGPSQSPYPTYKGGQANGLATSSTPPTHSMDHSSAISALSPGSSYVGPYDAMGIQQKPNNVSPLPLQNIANGQITNVGWNLNQPGAAPMHPAIRSQYAGCFQQQSVTPNPNPTTPSFGNQYPHQAQKYNQQPRQQPQWQKPTTVTPVPIPKPWLHNAAPRTESQPPVNGHQTSHSLAVGPSTPFSATIGPGSSSNTVIESQEMSSEFGDKISTDPFESGSNPARRDLPEVSPDSMDLVDNILWNIRRASGSVGSD